MAFWQNISLLVNAKTNKFNEKKKLVFLGNGNIVPKEKIND